MFNFWRHVERSTCRRLHVAVYKSPSTCRQCGPTFTREDGDRIPRVASFVAWLTVPLIPVYATHTVRIHGAMGRKDEGRRKMMIMMWRTRTRGGEGERRYDEYHWDCLLSKQATDRNKMASRVWRMEVIVQSVQRGSASRFTSQRSVSSGRTTNGGDGNTLSSLWRVIMRHRCKNININICSIELLKWDGKITKIWYDNKIRWITVRNGGDL